MGDISVTDIPPYGVMAPLDKEEHDGLLLLAKGLRRTCGGYGRGETFPVTRKSWRRQITVNHHLSPLATRLASYPSTLHANSIRPIDG